jgi:predicted RNA binding protein YcfA (HicA-like mRNA interferase family)
MPRLIPQPYQVLIKIFKKAGFSISRQGKKHIVMHKQGVARPLVIPRYNEVDVDIITSNIRTAGMTRKEYFKFLSDP